jgi:hypothetical protein
MRAMKRSSWILALAVLVVVVVAGWLWWVRPGRVDMATYAPANSLLYLESNRPLEVVEAITGTDAWKSVNNVVGPLMTPPQNNWVQAFVGRTGLGPVQSVVLARAQLAVVVTDLRTTEEGETLKLAPEGAVIIETHTAEWRIRGLVEQALKKLAEAAYGQPTFRRTMIDGVEFVEWTAPQGSRQIVAAIVGTLAIVGNTEQAVQNCLRVSLRRGPSLKDDPELHRTRRQLAGERALAFGYVPAGNSARLLSVGVPLMMGRAPGDSEFQRLLTTGAAKVFGSVAWGSQPFRTGIEDRYLISLQPSIIGRLKPNFVSNKTNSQLQQVLPADVYSVTYYKFDNPLETWQSMKTAVSSQIDALSAIVFSSLLKSALLSYGIEEPEKFLGAVNGNLLTARLQPSGERSMLIAGVRDRASLREMVVKTMGPNMQSHRLAEAEILEDSQGELAASFMNDFLVMGSPADVRGYAENAKVKGMMVNEETLGRMTFFVPFSSHANVVTYTNDRDRVRNFVSAIMAAKGAPPVAADRIEQVLAALPYSATETTLGEQGFQRTTRSPLGQFSTLLPLLMPEQPASTNNRTQSR